jgi:hypothetical protein
VKEEAAWGKGSCRDKGLGGTYEPGQQRRLCGWSKALNKEGGIKEFFVEE